MARHGTAERRALRTIGEAAAFVGTEPGAPESVYRATTPLEPDARLAIDADAATIVHSWFRLTASALEMLRQRHAALEPSIAQLWPEHFDLAVTMGEVTTEPRRATKTTRRHMPTSDRGIAAELVDDFWNEPFGAGRSHDELRSVDDVLALFESGHDLTSQRSR